MARSAASLSISRGPKPMPIGELVGLGLNRRADFKLGIAERDAIARLKAEAGEKRRIGGGSEHPAALGKGFGGRHRWSEHQSTIKRVGGIDGFGLDQRRAAIAGPRHGAHRRVARQRAHAFEEALLGGLRLALIRVNATSPPRSARPSRASPSDRLLESEPTPAIAITPSAMQAMKT